MALHKKVSPWHWLVIGNSRIGFETQAHDGKESSPVQTTMILGEPLTVKGHITAPAPEPVSIQLPQDELFHLGRNKISVRRTNLGGYAYPNGAVSVIIVGPDTVTHEPREKPAA